MYSVFVQAKKLTLEPKINKTYIYFALIPSYYRRKGNAKADFLFNAGSRKLNILEYRAFYQEILYLLKSVCRSIFYKITGCSRHQTTYALALRPLATVSKPDFFGM